METTTRDFGDLVIESAGNGGSRIAVHTDGFHAVGPNGPISARWDEVAFVNRSHVRVTVVAWATEHTRVEIGTIGGGRFALEGRGENVAAAAREIASRAMPHVAARLFAETQAGWVAFGPELRLSSSGLRIGREGKDRELPFSRLAGYKVAQGVFLVDEDPARPKLFAQLPIGRMTNPDAFFAVLDRLAPGKDLAEARYRVPGSVWRTSAATHDPRYVSTRTRMIAFVGVPGILVALGVVLLLVNSAYRASQAASSSKREAETVAAFQANVRAHIASIEAAPVPTKTVSEACPAFNPSGSRIVLVADPGIAALGPDFSPSYETSGGTGPWLTKGLPKPPFGEQPQMMIVRVLSATDGKEEGTARELVRIVSTKTSEVVCEGVADGKWMVGSAEEAERLPHALVKLALMDVCRFGDSGTCTDVGAKDGIFLRHPEAPAAASASSKPTARKARR